MELDLQVSPEEIMSREVELSCESWTSLRPQKRDGLLGTGTEWKGDDRVKARPRKPSEKDRRDRGPPPEQWKC